MIRDLRFVGWEEFIIQRVGKSFLSGKKSNRECFGTEICLVQQRNRYEGSVVRVREKVIEIKLEGWVEFRLYSIL